MVYSVLSLLFSLQLRENLDAAKADCTPVTVAVEQVNRADNSSYWYAVVLRPVDALPAAPSAPPEQEIGAIYATTLQPSLSVGQQLTAYYNESERQVELVDFSLAEPMFTIAMIGLALSAVILIYLSVRLILFLRRRRHLRVPPDPGLF